MNACRKDVGLAKKLAACRRVLYNWRDQMDETDPPPLGPANPYDNATCESFLKALKREGMRLQSTSAARAEEKHGRRNASSPISEYAVIRSRQRRAQNKFRASHKRTRTKPPARRTLRVRVGERWRCDRDIVGSQGGPHDPTSQNDARRTRAS